MGVRFSNLLIHLIFAEGIVCLFSLLILNKFGCKGILFFLFLLGLLRSIQIFLKLFGFGLFNQSLGHSLFLFSLGFVLCLSLLFGFFKFFYGFLSLFFKMLLNFLSIFLSFFLGILLCGFFSLFFGFGLGYKFLS